MSTLELVELIAVGLALGLLLGLLGGGGGILAVPALVHVAGQSYDQASTGALLIVAAGAAAGLVPHARAGRVAWSAGLTFAAIGSVGAVVGSRLALRMDDRLQLLGLILLMLFAARAMLRDGAGSEPPPPPDASPPRPLPHRIARLVVSATAVGLLTGIFGVGGGFLAVPALIFGIGLPVRMATATGLVVITINALVSMVAHGVELLDPQVIWVTGSAAMIAAVAGALLSHRVPASGLRYGFGWLLVGTAALETASLVTQVASGG